MSKRYGGKVGGAGGGGTTAGNSSAAAVSAAIGEGFHHRSNYAGGNKAFKKAGSTQRTKSRSKAGGKVERAGVKAAAADLSALKRKDRVNTSKQLLKQKRTEDVARKRVGSSQGPPRVVALIALGAAGVDLGAVRALFKTGCNAGSSIPHTNALFDTVAYALGAKAFRVTLYQCPRDDMAILDIAKASDLLVFVVAADAQLAAAAAAVAPQVAGAGAAAAAAAGSGVVPTDLMSRHIVTTLRAQGMPAVMGLVQGLHRFDAKKIIPARKAAHDCLKALVGDADMKVQSIDSAEDAELFRRTVANIQLKTIAWRDSRSYLLAENVTFKQLTPHTGTLRVSGYLRGDRALSVNQLIHLTGHGDYQMLQIDGVSDHALRAKDLSSAGPSKPVSRRGSAVAVPPVPAFGAAFEFDMTGGAGPAAAAAKPKGASAAAAAAGAGAGASGMNVDAGPRKAVAADPRMPSTVSVPSKNERARRAAAAAAEVLAPQGFMSGGAAAAAAAGAMDDGASASSRADSLISRITGINTLMNSSTGSQPVGAVSAAAQAAGLMSISGLAPAPGAMGQPVLTKLAVADPAVQESLDGLKPIDPLATHNNDQSIITEEELREAEAEQAKAAKDAQSVWNELLDDEEKAADAAMGRVADVAMATDAKAAEAERALAARLRAGDKAILTRSEKKKLEREDMNAPDHVETPLDVPAKQRFIKYRGLKSFQFSKWDPYENLPLEYSQIYEFEDFKAVNKAVKNKPHTLQMARPVAAGANGMDDDKDDTVSVASAASAASAASGSVADVDGGVSGHVVIYIANVEVRVAQAAVQSPLPFLVWGLLQHERKVSVLHFALQRPAAGEYDEPVKGKDEMLIHVGFRRFTARPIYSQQINNCDKNLGQRFFRAGQYAIASVYGRIMFPPCNVLMFLTPAAAQHAAANAAANAGAVPVAAPAAAAASGALAGAAGARSARLIAGGDAEMGVVSGRGAAAAAAAPAAAAAAPAAGAAPIRLPYLPLVASGTVHAVDPTRCIIKRIVLSGYPVSVHKRMAVIRYMFYRPEDVRWFKPVEVKTKNGLTGHIREARGTKGYLKANFSDFIKQNDTVLMDLYKRQFPKWDPNAFNTAH